MPRNAKEEPPEASIFDVKSESGDSNISEMLEHENGSAPAPGVSLSPRTVAQEQLLGESTPSWSNRKGQGRGAHPGKKCEVQKDHLKQKVGKGTFFGSYRSALQAIQSHLAKQKSQDEKGKGDGKGTQSYRKARGGRKAQGKAQQKSWPKNSNWSPHWKPAEPAVRVEPPWKPPERSVRIDAPREVQSQMQLKQLTDLLELVAGQDSPQRRHGGWHEEKEVGDIRFNTETVSQYFNDRRSIYQLSKDRDSQTEAGLEWHNQYHNSWILSNFEPLVVVHHKGADVVVKGRRRLKAALLLKQNLRSRLYVRCHCYDLDSQAAEVPGTVLALYALSPAANLDVLAV